MVEMTVAAEEGNLTLAITDGLCFDAAPPEAFIKFRGTVDAVNDALTGIYYLVSRASIVLSWTLCAPKLTGQCDALHAEPSVHVTSGF